MSDYVPGITHNQRKHIYALKRAARASDKTVKAIVADVTSGRTDSLSVAGGLTMVEAVEVVARLDRLEVERRPVPAADDAF